MFSIPSPRRKDILALLFCATCGFFLAAFSLYLPKALAADTTPPLVTNLQVFPDSGTHTSDRAILQADVSDEDPAISCEFTVDGANWIPGTYTAAFSNCSSYPFSLGVLDGQSVSLNIRATDSSANSGLAPAPLLRTIDAENPIAQVTLAADAFDDTTFDDLNSINGTMDDFGGSGIERVEIFIERVVNGMSEYWNGSEWTVDFRRLTAELNSPGTWRYNATLLHSTFADDQSYSIGAVAWDRVGYAGAGSGGEFTWNPAPPVQTFCGRTIDQFDAVIDGTSANDTLSGTSGDDLIRGFGGADTIDGKQGSDCLLGGAGADEISGGAGADVLKGGKGEDRLRGEGGNDKLVGGTGNDQLNGGAGSDTCTDTDTATFANCELPLPE